MRDLLTVKNDEFVRLSPALLSKILHAKTYIYIHWWFLIILPWCIRSPIPRKRKQKVKVLVKILVSTYNLIIWKTIKLKTSSTLNFAIYMKIRAKRGPFICPLPCFRRCGKLLRKTYQLDTHRYQDWGITMRRPGCGVQREVVLQTISISRCYDLDTFMTPDSVQKTHCTKCLFYTHYSSDTVPGQC